MVQQVLAVLLVLALLGAALWLLRRKGVAKINMKFARRTASGRHLEIVDRIALTAHHSLHLVRVENRTILIGVSPQGCAQVRIESPDSGRLTVTDRRRRDESRRGTHECVRHDELETTGA